MPLTAVRREAMHLYAREPRSRSAKNAVDALLRLHRAEEYELEQARIRSGLTKNEFAAVRYMLQAHHDGRMMGPKDLAVMLNLSNASITKLVDRLVASGDFTRVPHPTDRRAQILEPTVQAAKKIDEAYGRFHEIVVEVIDHLTHTDNDTLTRCLDTLTTALDHSSTLDDTRGRAATSYPATVTGSEHHTVDTTQADKATVTLTAV